MSTNTNKPPTTSSKKPSDAGYISQTSRGVSKQIAQALEIDNLGKMDAVDILSVLKRIENLEKMAQKKAATSTSGKTGGARQSSQNNGMNNNSSTSRLMMATSGSGGGGSIPNDTQQSEERSPTGQQAAATAASLKQKHAKLAKMLNNSKLI